MREIDKFKRYTWEELAEADFFEHGQEFVIYDIYYELKKTIGSYRVSS